MRGSQETLQGDQSGQQAQTPAGQSARGTPENAEGLLGILRPLAALMQEVLVQE